MLEQFEEDYLQTVSDTERVTILPYNPVTKEIADDILGSVRKVFPNIDARFIGAAALGMAGRNDVDLFLFTKSQDLTTFLPKINSILGQPSKISDTTIKWAFQRKGLEVEVHITDPNLFEVARQIRVYELLKKYPALRAEYGQIKVEANGLSIRQYYRRKFEFYHKILADA